MQPITPISGRWETIITPTVPIRLLHDGYDASKVDTVAKYRRNLAILLNELALSPRDPRILYFVGREYALLGEYAPSLHALHLAEREALHTHHAYLEKIQEWVHRIKPLTNGSDSSPDAMSNEIG